MSFFGPMIVIFVAVHGRCSGYFRATYVLVMEAYVGARVGVAISASTIVIVSKVLGIANFEVSPLHILGKC